MYKEDLALNNLQWLIRHKTQYNLTKPSPRYYQKSTKSGGIVRFCWSVCGNYEIVSKSCLTSCHHRMKTLLSS